MLLRRFFSTVSPTLFMFILIVSCGHHRPNNEMSEEINKEVDTITIFPKLPEAPLITPREADRSNPSYTGYVEGWEERLKNAYADSHLNVQKH